jgi:CRP-like cAMP-binding protein
VPDKLEQQLRPLRAAFDAAMRDGRSKEAVAVLLQLEPLEPRQARWPHKRGDLLRKLGSQPEAVQAYALAADLYMEQGFLARAIAMAKVILEVDPGRADVLERLDPSRARALHRQARPEAVHVDDGVAQRSLEATAILLGNPRTAAVLLGNPKPPPGALPPAIPRASAAPGAGEAIMELSDAELEDCEPSGPAAPPPVPTDAREPKDEREAEPRDPQDELGTELRAEAHRLASLPLFPLFAEIPREAMLTLARESRLRALTDGEVLLRAGDPADSLFGIVAGQFRVLVPGVSADKPVLLGEGEVLGESCLLGDERRRADVVAAGTALALEIPKATLNYLVRVHSGLGEVLLELLTRRLLGNLLRTAGPFRGLSSAARKQIAALFTVRRARSGAQLLQIGEPADALYITLTGHVEVERAGVEPTEVFGAGSLFGQQSLVGGALSEIGVRTRENQLVLVLPGASFSRICMEHYQVLAEIAELAPIAKIAS